MTKYEHQSVTLGFVTTAEDQQVVIKGKRRWYAPWLRYPDRVHNPVEVLSDAVDRAQNRMAIHAGDPTREG